LFLPQAWFTEEKAALRAKLGVPKDRTFQTKVQLGWAMIERLHARKLPFECVCCDALYGRSRHFRAQMDQAGVVYMAEVPRDLWVYETDPATLEAPPKRVSVEAVAKDPSLVWERIVARPTERGEITGPFAARRVFAPYDPSEGTGPSEGTCREEWLVVRRHEDESLSYALSNAPAETSLSRLAELKCGRHFVECSIRDAKSEIGWDDLRARKFRAWEHHLALTILATWFLAQTKLDWAREHPPDPTLKEELGVDRLPELSVANVREMLRAVMPLPQLSDEEAVEVVVDHLIHRSSSRKSRMKKRSPPKN
jgi:SRSO17 transposase